MKLIVKLFAILALIAFTPACGDDVGDDETSATSSTSTTDSHDDHDDHGHDDHGHGDHDGHDHDPNEVMTTVNLTFTPESGGDAVTAGWADPEADGDPVITPITLNAGETYTLTIEILNELENPAEDVTIEIRDELEEHQFFFAGEVVSGPTNASDSALITHAYDDMDSNGYPVGLTNTITADTAGMGELTLMLRHMPPVNGTAIKTENLADVARDSGFGELPGSTDIEVTFDLTVE